MRSLAVAALILAVSGGLSAAQTNDRDPILTVHGHGRVEVAPDHARLTVELVTKGKSLQAATAAHRERAPRATKALRDLKQDGLEIERSVFRLNEIRQPPTPAGPPGRGDSEYQAVTTYELKTTQLDKVDGTITAVAATGLFEVRSLRFGIDEKNPGLNAARKSAVADSRERATNYADAAGVQLGDIVRIEDTEARIPREFAVNAPMMRSAQVIPPESLTLSASVTITWRISAKP